MTAITCSHCGKGNVIPMEESKELYLCTNTQCSMAFRGDMSPLVSLFTTAAADPRPDMPTDAIVTQVVCDFHTDKNGNVTFTSRTYIPKENVPETPFNPNDPTFKFAMKVHRKRFKNRRRYRYNKARQMETVGTEASGHD